MSFEQVTALVAVALLLAALLAAIHIVEQAVQQRLARSLGWRAVLLTGWLGTPIHELSHAVTCWIFGHRIDDIQLFSPDPRTGRLGYVKHSFQSGHWWQELGTVAIATAPLFGGGAVLLALAGWFYPDSVREAWNAFTFDDRRSIVAQLQQLSIPLTTLLGGIFQWNNWGTVRLWVFLYLVLCVGCHWAPSRTDYQGAIRGAVVLGFMLFAAGILLWVFPSVGSLAVNWLIAVGTVLVAMAILALSLMVASAMVVWLGTALILPVRKG